MMRHLIRSPLCALLSGLMLVACGGAPEEAGLAPFEEPLGTQESALCSGTSVSGLTISGVSSWGGELAGNGSWAVAGGANAVKLEYYVDGVLKVSEERTGTSGTWYFSMQGMTCGAHTFEVRAYPMVIDSAGNRTTCWSSTSKTASQSVTQACPNASISCSHVSTTVTCNASASGGSGGPYTYIWQEVHEPTESPSWSSGWFQSGTSESFYCSPSMVFFPADFVHLEVKVRDSSGMVGPVSFGDSYLCEI